MTKNVTLKNISGFLLGKDNDFTGLLTNIQKMLEGGDFTSSIHPYGFIVLKLGQVNRKDVVRLHIWPGTQATKEFKPIQSRIHNHSWNLHSCIICGRLTNEVWGLSVNQSSKEQLYSITYQGTNSISVPSRVFVNANLISSNTYTSGDKYKLRTNEFHRVVKEEGEFRATILLSEYPEYPEYPGEPERSPLVLRNDQDTDSMVSFDREKVDITLVDSSIQKLLITIRSKLIEF